MYLVYDNVALTNMIYDELPNLPSPIINLPPPVIEKVIVDIPRVVAEYPHESWYDTKWFIALLASFFGASATIVIQSITTMIGDRKYRKQIARDLLTEIQINVRKNQTLKPSVTSTLKTFKSLVETGDFISHPSIIVTGTETSKIFFEKYLDRLYLLPSRLQSAIHIFYQVHVRNFENSIRITQESFRSFYSSSKLVSEHDVVVHLQSCIDNIDALVELGFDLMGELLLLSGENRNIVTGNEKKHLSELGKIKNYLKTLDNGTEVIISDLTKLLSVDPIILSMSLAKNRHFLKISSGKFKKMPKLWRVRAFAMKIFMLVHHP